MREIKPFLYYVAEDLVRRYGKNLSQVTTVFPGKRAQLYMNQFLTYFAQGPVWAPRFVTIDELFLQLSPYTVCDPILSVCKLYSIYSQLVSDPEPLDNFYGWGEILVNDFDDIDKHMIDAQKLFTNAADLAAMDQVDFLRDEQIKVLHQFFAKFDIEHQTEIKHRFLHIWRIMPEMYSSLKAKLQSEGLLYKGGLYRDVAERISHPDFLQDSKHSILKSTFAFVGFNVLDEVEETVFTALRDAGKALFYWDYDNYYTKGDAQHEAGLFLRHNLKRYPNALPDSIFDNLLSTPKQIRFLSASTDNAQVRYLPQWISQKLTTPANQSAVVLCDESLMQSALHAIPAEKVNVTMGYPLTDTAVYGYYCALIDLQTDGYDPDLHRFRPSALERLMLNPFFSTYPHESLPLIYQPDNTSLIRWLTAAFEALGGADVECAKDPLNTEVTFQIYRTLGQFNWLLSHAELNISTTTLRRLLRKVFSSASVPFHGEMDKGLQVMGILETRNLDFRHLIMISAGEGVIPRRSDETSLIPYILRVCFGLDTSERQDAVYAYSFYRLLQRAEDITLVYNNNSAGTSQREQSRFMRQLSAETSLPIQQGELEAPLSISSVSVQPIAKDERTMQALCNKSYLSPTALNQYIECPLRFYYQQVANLRMPSRPQDGIDSPLFGTLFHDSCEFIYTHLRTLTGRNEVCSSDLAPLTAHRDFSALSPYLDLAFWVDVFHASEYESLTHEEERRKFLAPYLEAKDRDTLSRMTGELYAEGTHAHFTGLNMIIRDVLLQLLSQLVQWDAAHTPFTIEGMEKAFYDFISVPTPKGDIKVKIGGRIDRLDIMDINGRSTMRIVDYKTGRSKSGPSGVAAIFESNTHNARGYYLQAFLYSLILRRSRQMPVSPCLFYVLSATDPQAYDPMLRFGREPITDVEPYAQEFTDQLTQLLGEIFNPDVPFRPTEDRSRTCQYCDFRMLCGIND